VPAGTGIAQFIANGLGGVQQTRSYLMEYRRAELTNLAFLSKLFPLAERQLQHYCFKKAAARL